MSTKRCVDCQGTLKTRRSSRCSTCVTRTKTCSICGGRKTPASKVCRECDLYLRQKRSIHTIDNTIENIRKLSSEDRAYLAGFLDGEGSVSIICEKRKNNKRSYRLQLHIASTGIDVFIWLKNLLGVCFWEGKKAAEHHKTHYRVTFRGDAALELLEAIEPYLKLKKKHVEIARKFIQARKKYILPVEKRNEVFDSLWEEMSKLRIKGPIPKRYREEVII